MLTTVIVTQLSVAYNNDRIDNMKQQNNSSLSDRTLTAGYWIARHHAQLRKAGVGLLALFAGAWIIVAIGFFLVWLLHVPQTREIEQQLATSVLLYGEERAPEQISIESAYTVARSDDSVDLLISLRNPNAYWGATAVHYDISVNGKAIGTKTTTLLPGQQAYYAVVNIPAESPSTSTARVTLPKVEWKRIEKADTTIVPTWTTSNEKIHSVQATGEGSPQSVLEFDLHNRSIYGFRTVDVVALVKDSSDTIIAIGYYPINEIQSLEKRHLTMQWPKHIPTTSNVTFSIHVDVLDSTRIIR
jgi:hypothetical protein